MPYSWESGILLLISYLSSTLTNFLMKTLRRLEFLRILRIALSVTRRILSSHLP